MVSEVYSFVSMSNPDEWDVIKADVETAQRKSTTMREDEATVHSVESREGTFYIVRLDTNQEITEEFLGEVEAEGYQEADLFSDGDAWMSIMVVPNDEKRRWLAEL